VQGDDVKRRAAMVLAKKEMDDQSSGLLQRRSRMSTNCSSGKKFVKPEKSYENSKSQSCRRRVIINGIKGVGLNLLKVEDHHVVAPYYTVSVVTTSAICLCELSIIRGELFSLFALIHSSQWM
jgi:hypothetical protein